MTRMHPDVVMDVPSERGRYVPLPEKEKSSARALRYLLRFVVLNAIVLNLAVVSFNEYLVNRHLSPHSMASFGPLASFVTGQQHDDSLRPMLVALHAIEESPTSSPYEAIFFESHVKFQYPLTSLLPYYALQRMGMSDHDLFLIFKVTTWISICVTILLSIAIGLAFRSKGSLGGRSRQEFALVSAAVGLGGLFFYPLMKGFSLGQIQTILVLGFTTAFYCWMIGREKTAGAIMGLMALVKPQYALFLVWALLRKRFGAFSSGLVCAASGVLISCVAFGWHNNLDYLRVLTTISRSGESYAANQSVNGLLNRLLFNGNNLFWDGTYFPPYNPIVYFGTLATSLGLVGLALFYPWGAKRIGGVADFACIILTATMASPIAWEHHYGILLPIFAWLWFGEYAVESKPRGVFTIGAAYVLTSNYIVPLSALASIPVLNILQSHLFFGALLVLILLVRPPATVSNFGCQFERGAAADS